MQFSYLVAGMPTAPILLACSLFRDGDRFRMGEEQQTLALFFFFFLLTYSVVYYVFFHVLPRYSSGSIPLGQND